MDPRRNVKKILKYFEPNKNKNITQQNFWDTTKGIPREKFMALNVQIRKERSDIVLCASITEARKHSAN